MAYTDVPVQFPGKASEEESLVNWDTGEDGMAINNDGHTILFLDNKSGSETITLTAETPKTVEGLAVAEQDSRAMAPGERTFWGPFSQNLFNVQSGTDKGKIRIVVKTGVATDLDITALSGR